MQKHSFDTVVDQKLKLHAYTYPSEQWRLPVAPIFRQIASAKDVRYKLTVGSKEVEYPLAKEVHEAIGQLVDAARYEDRQVLLKQLGL